jgi:UDP-N-acetylmuramoyl-tripeptide--D-alanyl-D-alanine ligase
VSFWTLDRVRAALREEGTGHPAGGAAVAGVATDTRALEPGHLFVALRGERFDAHDFLADAVRRGAGALVVEDPRPAARAGVPVYVVRDTVAALGALGRYRRRAWGRPVVAVAGSNGKTSTRELIRAALASRFHVHASAGNFNNQVGVPLTLLAIPDDADMAVVEIGTNHPGEVGALRAIVEPDIAVVTSIGEEHLEGLGSLEGVLREEASVFDGVSLGVAPAAQPEVGRAARSRAAQVVEAGLDAGDLRPDAWGLSPETRGWFTLGATRIEVPLLGVHNLRNALLAAAVARACGIGAEDMARGMAALQAIPMRSQLESVGSLLVINDAYNANPASAREALATLDVLDTPRPRAVVLGSMLELGPQGPALHDEIARRAVASAAAVIAGVGEFERALRAAAPGDPRIVTASDADALWPLLRERLAADAVVLLKGSRGMRLERLMPRLREFGGAAATADISSGH